MDSISILEKNELNKGIWNLIDNLIEGPLNMKNIGYKDVYAISQLFLPFNNNNIFCFEIKIKEKCFKCNYNSENIDYLCPII